MSKINGISFGSVCSGIEAASVAWFPLGWKATWLAEIEAFPSAVLKHHYPDVPNLGDMTKLPKLINNGEIEAPDLFCGGTPCQAFSVVGLRKSLDDARGNLSLVFCEIANAIDTRRAGSNKPPAIIFWENVPGVLSTKDNAFGCFLAGLAGEDDPLTAPGGKWTNAGCVFGPARTVAWRVLDAQYFGVAQRRRRVFVVASARTGFDPVAVLFEFDGLRRDTAPIRKTGQVAPTIPARSLGGGGLGTDFDCDCGVIEAYGGNNTAGQIDVATARNACASASGRMDFEGETFLVQPAIGWDEELNASTEQSGTLLRGGQGGRHDGVMTQSMQVRRLTPVEFERLQGFPDNYTAIPWRGKPADMCPDGPRYKALGNSWAVPNVAWIGSRIDLALKLSNSQRDEVKKKEV